MVQWLRLRAPTTGGTGSIPGWGTKTLRATWCDQKKKKKLLGMAYGRLWDSQPGKHGN